MNALEKIIWSLPDRLLLWFAPVHSSVAQEEYVCRAYAYLWIARAQLRQCAELYGSRPSFLQDVLDHVYRPLLSGGQSAPFPVVAYVAVGYTLRHIVTPVRLAGRGSARDGDSAAGTVLPRFIGHLNRWLDEILFFDYPSGATTDEIAQIEIRRANWPALRQFALRALAPHEIGPLDFPAFDPAVCDSERVRTGLWSAHGRSGVEQRLLTDLPPAEQSPQDQMVDGYLSAMMRLIDQRVPPERGYRTGEEDQSQKVWNQQRRAIRYYLNRSGVAIAAPPQDDDKSVLTAARSSARCHLLDLHALAGYQTYAKFVPDTHTALLLELLRRHLIDPTLTQRARESTVEGVARRGSISQVLKWQLALKDDKRPPDEAYAYVYERFFNHKMLYLRRISRQSQDLALTLLIAIDLSAPAHRHAPHGGRAHSLLREVCAHLVQDCFQVLWQVPKLYADAVIVIHDGQRVVWRSTMVLTTGHSTGPFAEDIFLKDRPEWLTDEDNFADPPSYFHFLPVALTSQPHTEETEALYEDLALDEQIAEAVRAAQRARVAWFRGARLGAAAGGAALPTADLLVSVVASAAADNDALSQFDALQGLGLMQQAWLCDVGEYVRLRLMAADAEDWADWSSLSDFQHQRHGLNTAQQRPSSLRQSFVQELLRALLALCADAEIR